MAEVGDAYKLRAARQFTARIHARTEAVVHGLAAKGGIHFVAVAERAVAVAPAAHHVEALQREAGRVNFRMAQRAALDGAMRGELLAHGRGTAHIRLDGGNARWRRWRGSAEEIFQDPCAARDGRCGRAIGADFQNARLGEETTARTVLRQWHATNGEPLDTRDSVELRESSIHHREIRRDEMRGAEVAAQHVVEECVRLAQH